MSDNIFSKNIQVLKSRFPALADKALRIPFSDVATVATEDGGICYAAKTSDGKWVPISPHENPIAKSKQALELMEKRIINGFSPAVIVGLYPGYVLDTIFRHFESRLSRNETFRHIYVVIDSMLCFLGWLKAADRSDILSRQEVMFLESGELYKIIELCENDLQRSHLFIPVSELPDSELNEIIQPLVAFYLKRENEEKIFRQENDRYYDSISDSELAKIISGKAGRKPRLLTPTHVSSNVIQFSTRDICGTFEKMGWETKILKMEQDLSPWLMTKTIHDFKPDLFVFIDHTRTEDPHLCIYPSNMTFVTWIQDAMPSINRCDAAEKWNRAAASKSLNGIRDLLTGYVSQLKQYGYMTERLVEMSMIVDANVFKPVNLSGEEQEKYSCDVCFASNRGKNTEKIIEESLLPLLSPHGFNRSCLYEIHNILWKHYLDGKSIITPKELEDFLLLNSESFKKVFTQLEQDERSNTMDRIFWILNDPLYRFIVIKWLDEYAGLHPGFKIHIYGRDWETHPDFKKYSKGIILHGSELNLAYNAAKYCLHLNSNESSHQRLLEITGAGSKVLARDSRYTSRTKSLNNALGKIADRIFINTEQEPEKLSKDEIEELNSYIFLTAQQILNGKHDPDNIKNEVIKSLKMAMIKDDKWLLPPQKYKFFNSKDELFRLLDNYEKIPSGDSVSLLSKFRNDIHVDIICEAIMEALGCKKEDRLHVEAYPGFSEVIEFAVASYSDSDKLSEIYEELEYPGFDITYNYITMLLKKGLKEKAASLLKEIDIEKLLPSQQRDYIEMLFLFDIEKAGKLIENLYSRNNDIKDVFAKSAWSVFWPQKQYDKIIEFCQRDEKHNRLSPAWRLFLAQAYAAKGDIDTAEKHVKTAYGSNSNIKDGYAGLAWYKHFFPKKNYTAVAKWLEKDFLLDRLSIERKIDLALAYAYNDQFDDAEKLIENIYRISPNIQDAYSQIGWDVFWKQLKQQEALEWFELEKRAGRFSIQSLYRYITVLGANGLLDKAAEIIDTHHELKNAYSYVASGCTSTGHFKEAALLFNKELNTGHFTPEHWNQYLSVALINEDYDTIRKFCKTNACHISPAVLNVIGYFYQSKITCPNFAKLMDLLDIDLAYKEKTLSFHLAKIHISFLLGSEHEIQKNLISIKNQNDLQIRSHAGITFLQQAVLNGYGLNEINDIIDTFSFSTPDLISKAATWFGISGTSVKAQGLFEELYRIEPYYFMEKSITVYNQIMWYSVIAKKHGDMELSDGCLEFSKLNSPLYSYYEERINEFLKSASAPKLPLPLFPFPFLKNRSSLF